MEEISLRGKVAIITGAGRGLGRLYALLFAERGARIVVNDLGSAIDGSGASSEVAQEVVEEIRLKGGVAVANGDDVSIPQGGTALVRQALDTFGQLDIVVNNAGICRDRSFAETTAADFEHYWRNHLLGHFNVTSAAWPIMTKQRHGSIVMTASGAGLFGMRHESTYAAAKGAIYGLMRSLAIEGADHGIRVNCVCPGGVTRMHDEAFPNPEVREAMRQTMPPELVAPAVLWLASDACPITGETLSVWGGRVARVVVGTGRGYIDRALTPEALAIHWSEAASNQALYEARDGIDDVGHWMGEIAKAST